MRSRVIVSEGTVQLNGKCVFSLLLSNDSAEGKITEDVNHQKGY